MSDLSDQFRTLPPDFQQVLQKTQEKYQVGVSPLQELKGGRTGAFLFLVSVNDRATNRVQHLILKLDHKSKKTKLDELERHRSAIEHAPVDFREKHIASLAFERVEHDEAIAIFYSIAGQSLNHFNSLASYREQSKLEQIFTETNLILLEKWNPGPDFDNAVHPQKVLSRWLGYRLQPGGNIERFLQDYCNIDADSSGLMIRGNVFPNPLMYSRKVELWGDARPLDILVGFQHGDLNIGNILTKFRDEDETLSGYYLIDFALFKEGMPLFYDKCYLEMSYLLRELSRVSLDHWTDFVGRYASQDTPDPQQVPVELSGACSVINAGRRAFGAWVEKHHPSLADDLWGQYRLAAVAAGLNYCNKSTISEKERMAGLIFAAAHLKHYHATFGVPLPAEIRILNVSGPTKAVPETAFKRVARTDPQHNLPAQTTQFLGRTRELTVLHDLVDREDVRLLTLTGPGGTGKTRLALKVSEGLIEKFEDGIYFIDLASVSAPENVLATVARTIGYRESSDRSLIEELVSNMKSSKLLLILDNFEQLTGAAPMIGELLRGCPQLKLLVTSREALHISGEHVFSVPPLAVPAEEIKGKPLQEVAAYEAIQLFAERASAARSGFELTEENAPVVAEICHRLDGLPLAIELAAARITLFSPRALLERVGDSLKLLRGGARDIPLRQQTLRGAIDWSFDLLDQAEQKLFTMLSVFSGCTFEQVEVIAGGIRQIEELHMDIFDGLGSLLDKSLLTRNEQGNGETRLVMLGTIREYAREKLSEDSAFEAEAQRAHATYFSKFCQLQWKKLTGEGRESALNELGPEIDNIRTAWMYWVKEGNLELLQDMTDFLWLFYDARGWYYATVELTRDLLKVLASSTSTPERAQQEILLQTSLARVMMTMDGCTPEVEQAYTRALDLCQKHGEVPQSLPVIRALAGFYAYIADFKKSSEFGKRILDLAEQLNDENMKAEGHLVYGYNLAFLGDPVKALEHLSKGIELYNPAVRGSQSYRIGNNPGVTAHTTSALLLWMTGHPDRALVEADRGIQLAGKLNHPYVYAYALFHAGLLHLWRMEFDIVLERAQQALEIARKHDFSIWEAVATCLNGAALSGKGQGMEGYKEFEKGMKLYSELKTPPVFWPILLLLRAITLAQIGKLEDAIGPVEQAIGLLEQGGGNPMLVDFYRIKGELLLHISPQNAGTAESLFRQSIDLAKQNQTLMFELKSAVSLCQVLEGQDKAGEGLEILTAVYNKFSEGSDTRDLVLAREMISKLS